MRRHHKGFTLLEILLVVAAIGILAGIVIVAVNPVKQLGDTRNAQRRSDINTILNAVYQYTIDSGGSLPGTITQSTTCENTAAKQICKTTASGNCTGGTVLNTFLTANEKYLVTLPVDPGVTSGEGTDYFIVRSANGRITVCAPSAENSVDIRVTR